MGIKEIAKKLLASKKESSESGERGLSADDRELMGYKEEDRREVVKKQLDYYRKKKVIELMIGKIVKDPHNILKAKEVFTKAKFSKKTKRIEKPTSLFFGR